MAATRPIGRESDQPTPAVLLERSSELSLLQDQFEKARTGSGGAVTICGGAGTGKTALVEAFLSSLADPSEVTVFWGECDDLLAPRTFGPFRDMIHGSGLLANDLADELGREDLLLSLLGVLDRPSRPAVMVVENGQWADDASVDVLRYLARRLTGLHAMLLVTVRDVDLERTHPVRSLLTGAGGGTPRRINLDPLSVEGVASLAGRSSLDPKYLHEVSGGNPLLVNQLLSADPADANRLAQETLVGRTERLSPEGRAAIQALSVLPEGADPTLARRLFEDRPEALHEAEGSGLLESTTERLRFRHELGRTAVMQAMSFAERLAATNQVLAALTDVGADPTVLVHIARAAGDGPRATQFAMEILDRSLNPTNPPKQETVWTLARIALESTGTLSIEQIASLHLQAANAGRMVGRHVQALEHADRAVRLYLSTRLDHGSTDPGPWLAGRAEEAADQALARAWLTLAALQTEAGDHLRARTGLRQAKTLLNRHPESELSVHCTTRLAASALIGGELSRGVELATSSIEVAESKGWSPQLADALAVRGAALGGAATAEGLADLERSIELSASHGPVDQLAATQLLLADGYLKIGRTPEAELLTDQTERFCREHDLARLDFQARVQRLRILIAQGGTAEADRLAQALATEHIDPGALKAEVDSAKARLLARRGDERAPELVDRAWASAKATGEIERMSFAAVTRMEQLWFDGDDEGLRQFARYLVGLGERHGHHRLRADGLRMLLRLGEAVEAFPECPAPLAAALVGDHDRSAELWREAGQPMERALELIETAEPAAAFEGLRLLDRSGASRVADLVRHGLRGQGIRGVPRGPRRASDGAVPVLTGRQVEVLRLLAQSQTNQQIADELFVARRTVDNHVSAILSRLGVEGRREAVLEARSRGLISD